MARTDDVYTLPPDLPIPHDDGRAAHLPGTPLPSLSLVATTGERIDLSGVRGLAVVFAYPRTGRPNDPPLVPDWDLIPGARGCTPHTCSFRDLSADFAALDARIFGLSTQDPEYQRELAERLHLTFPILSDAELALTGALRLPTLTVAGQVLIARLAWVQRDGVIEQVAYPVFPPDRNGPEMLERIRAIRSAGGGARDLGRSI
jgi:peroxiredoxin